MAIRLSRNAPYEIASLDIHSLNDVFRQIQQAVDELRGLQGPITVYDEVTHTEVVVFDTDQYATTAQIADVAATESAGTSTKIPRGDHVHKGDHGSLAGLSDDDHSLYPLVTNFEADRATIATNWTDLTDGGETALHSHAGGGSSSDTTLVDAPPSSQVFEEVLIEGGSMFLYELADGSAIKIRALQPISIGNDELVGELRVLTDGNGEIIYG